MFRDCDIDDIESDYFSFHDENYYTFPALVLYVLIFLFSNWHLFFALLPLELVEKLLSNYSADDSNLSEIP